MCKTNTYYYNTQRERERERECQRDEGKKIKITAKPNINIYLSTALYFDTTTLLLLLHSPLLIHDAAIIAIPINLATKRTKHGVLSNGRELRHVDGVTYGDGSDDQAH